MTSIAETLERLEERDTAALDRAFADFYPDLKRLAHARLRSSGLQGQLQTTALVHDSYLRVAGGPAREFPDRVHFLAYASRVLRSIVVDVVREHKALRRGGDVEMVTLDTAVDEGVEAPVDVEALNDALDDLAKLDPGLARLVEMRFFGGLTEVEIGEALGVAESTVRREWTKARTLLYTLLAD